MATRRPLNRTISLTRRAPRAITGSSRNPASVQARARKAARRRTGGR